MMSEQDLGLNNTDKKQQFRTWSLFIMLGLIGCCILVLALALHSHPTDRENALRRAESIAYQVVQIHTKMARSPASQSESEGQLGQDQWGNPYNYKLSSEDAMLRVEVWTAGDHSIRTSVRIPKNRL